jgi:hypothetical protein
MADTHISIVVINAKVEMARTIASTLSPAGYAEFRIDLRPKGDTGPPTHWLTSGWLGEKFVALTKDANALYDVCQQLQLPYSLESITELVETSVVRLVEETSALALLDELGLEIVPPLNGENP